MSVVLVAVCLPRHPTTGNAFRAPQDAAALALAHQIGAAVHVAHAGLSDARDDMRVYAGLGAACLTWVDTGDPVKGLAMHARKIGASLVLTGTEAPLGLGSGVFPYALAAELGWPLVANAREVEPMGNGWRCDAARSFGQLVEVRSSGPAVVTVSAATGQNRLPRFADARISEIDHAQFRLTPTEKPELVPAKRRPMPISAPTQTDYADRLRALMFSETGKTGRVIEDDSDTLAGEFLDELRRLGFGRT